MLAPVLVVPVPALAEEDSRSLITIGGKAEIKKLEITKMRLLRGLI